MSLHTRKIVKTLTSAFVSDPLVLMAFRIFPLTRPFRIFLLTRPWNLGHSNLGRKDSVWKSSNWNISRYKTSDFINKNFQTRKPCPSPRVWREVSAGDKTKESQDGAITFLSRLHCRIHFKSYFQKKKSGVLLWFILWKLWTPFPLESPG